MKIQRFVLFFGLMSVLLAACASPVKTPAALPTNVSVDGPGGGAGVRPPLTPLESAPTNNDTPITFPADTPVFTWSRQGGIAGFCEDVTVLASGAYSIVTCKDRETKHGQLTASQLLQLTRLVNKVQSFEKDNNDPAVADAMSVKTIFKGVGTLQASPEDLATLHNFAGLLLAQAWPANDGIAYPDAVAKARDFLTTQIGIPASDITVVSVETVEWSDACLGVVIMGMMCAQGITPGYRIILDAQDTSYELHTDESGDRIQQVTDPNLVKP